MRKFEEEVNIFVNKLINYDTNKFERAIFNPWKEFDETDISEQAPTFRVENLKRYLITQKDAQYILIAESPSTGARYSGIAMTSEKVIKANDLGYKFTSAKSKEGKYIYELTAKKVWDEILKSKNKFVMWNAFAFNIHESEKRWFENPTDKELENNLDLLNDFLALYKTAKIITVGKTAQNALNVLGFKDFESIRHPSNDFKKEFPEQFKKYLFD
jgi:Fe-S cluster biosynthesis and repair protein YggX